MSLYVRFQSSVKRPLANNAGIKNASCHTCRRPKYRPRIGCGTSADNHDQRRNATDVFQELVNANQHEHAGERHRAGGRGPRSRWASRSPRADSSPVTP